MNRFSLLSSSHVLLGVLDCGDSGPRARGDRGVGRAPRRQCTDGSRQHVVFRAVQGVGTWSAGSAFSPRAVGASAYPPGLFAARTPKSLAGTPGSSHQAAPLPFAMRWALRRRCPCGTKRCSFRPRRGSAAKFRPASRRPHDLRQARHRARRRGCGVAVCSADESGAYPAWRFPRRAERPRVARLAPWGPRWTSNPSGFRGQVALSQLRQAVSVSAPYACGPRLATRSRDPRRDGGSGDGEWAATELVTSPLDWSP